MMDGYHRQFAPTWLIAAMPIIALAISGCGGTSSSGPPLDENLLDNPGAESGSDSHGSLDGWEEAGCFSGDEYGAGDSELDAPPSEMSSPGSWYFAGGNQLCNDVATGRQVIRNLQQLSTSASDLEYQMSGWLGGVGTQRDYATFVAWFYGQNGTLLGADAIGPVTAEERMDQTTLVKRTASGFIPSRTSRIELTLMLKKFQGVHSGYADNLSFVLTSP
jgi:hypothetical protein